MMTVMTMPEREHSLHPNEIALDPVFNHLSPANLAEIRRILDWNPYVSFNEKSDLLTNFPQSAQLEWLDLNRSKLEDEVCSTGSWTFGSKRTYADVVRGLADEMKVAHSPGERMSSVERSILFKMWTSIEKKLGPKEKQELYTALAKEAEQFGKSFGPEMATFAALGAAQLSGFGVYMLGSTLLGAINGALGLGLGFGAFAGLAGLIAVVIGPIGWLSAGGIFLGRLTAPNYKKISQIVILMATCRNMVEVSINSTPTRFQVAPETRLLESPSSQEIVNLNEQEQLTRAQRDEMHAAIEAGKQTRRDAHKEFQLLAPESAQSGQISPSPTQAKSPANASNIWEVFKAEKDFQDWAQHIFGLSEINTWTKDDFEVAKTLFKDNPQQEPVKLIAPEPPIEPAVKLSAVTRLERSYKNYFPLLQFDQKPLAVLAGRDFAQRLEFESCFSRMNRGDLKPKCLIKHQVEAILEKQVGKRDERIYYRQLNGGAGARILLVGTKATQDRDITWLRSQLNS